ncbi:MAG: fasciclin domain-containing protein [Kofleriaceae bacterium]
MVPAPAGQSVVDIAREAGTFETLLAALDRAELTATLDGDGPFTVFAPTDAAFAALPEGALDELMADPARLADVLEYHVISGEEITGAEAARVMAWTTLEGHNLTFTGDPAGLMINNDTTVLQADVAADNGVVHVIDRVLMPPDAVPAIETPPSTETPIAPAGTT